LAVAICAHLLHMHGDTSVGSEFSLWHEKTAKDFMMARFQDAVEPGMIAKAVGLSEAAFASGFEKATQKSPQQWLTEYRVIQAKRYIDAREHTFEEVAKLSGFLDLEQLSYHFTAITGFSLQRWRNRGLN